METLKRNWFHILTLAATLGFIGLMIFISSRSDGGLSLLRDYTSLPGFVFVTLIWLLVPVFIALVLFDRIHLPSRWLFTAVFPLLFVVMVIGNMSATGNTSLSGDGVVNKAYVDAYRSQDQHSFMEFYLAASRPPIIEMNDPRLLEKCRQYGKEERVKRIWKPDVEPNVRAAITPPMFFVILLGFEGLLHPLLEGWYSLFGLFFGALAFFFLGDALRRSFSEKMASLILLSFLLYSPVTHYGGILLADSPSLFLFFLSIWMLVRSKESSLLWTFGAGVAVAFSIFTRLTFLPFGIILGLLLLIHSQNRWRQSLVFAAGAVSVLLVMLAIGYDPIVQIFINRQFIRLNTLAKGVIGNPLVKMIKLDLVLFTGLGFGWLLVLLLSLFKGRDRQPMYAALWNSRWLILFFLATVAYLRWSEPERNMIALLPLLMTLGIRQEKLLVSKPVIITIIISQVLVNYSRIIL